MSERFFEDPILNSPYACPTRHWELVDGIPTQRELEGRRESRLITPIPQPRKRGGKGEQRALAFGAQGLSDTEQQYEVTQQINSIRALVEEWRQAPESQWKVTAETARLLKHWRHHDFQGIRPFWCQIEATATVAEQWGRRWITIDTSRVALALARARIMGARYPYYLLADSSEGKLKEAELTRSMPNTDPASHSIRQGFVYERIPHITLKSIANNTEIDTIWEKWQSTLEPLREQLNTALAQTLQEWDIPREAQPSWSYEAKSLHAKWWDARIARQMEIDASIAAKADSEYLYDKPYEDKSKVRVAGPFTVESLSPHRSVIVNDDDTISDPLKQGATAEGATDFAQMILNTLRVAGVQQAHKQDRISFESLDGWPGILLAGKGSYRDADGTLKSAGIFIGPSSARSPASIWWRLLGSARMQASTC